MYWLCGTLRFWDEELQMESIIIIIKLKFASLSWCTACKRAIIYCLPSMDGDTPDHFKCIVFLFHLKYNVLDLRKTIWK